MCGVVRGGGGYGAGTRARVCLLHSSIWHWCLPWLTQTKTRKEWLKTIDSPELRGKERVQIDTLESKMPVLDVVGHNDEMEGSRNARAGIMFGPAKAMSSK